MGGRHPPMRRASGCARRRRRRLQRAEDYSADHRRRIRGVGRSRSPQPTVFTHSLSRTEISAYGVRNVTSSRVLYFFGT
eukprot:7387357-Prymnesium_polylepis.1